METISDQSSGNVTVSVQGSVEENREKLIRQKIVERQISKQNIFSTVDNRNNPSLVADEKSRSTP